MPAKPKAVKQKQFPAAEGYTPEFWVAAWTLANSKKQCEQCGKYHNTRTRPQIIVRIVLKGDGSVCVPNLAMLCKDCFRDPVPFRVSKKQILAQIAELPFGG